MVIRAIDEPFGENVMNSVFEPNAMAALGTIQNVSSPLAGNGSAASPLRFAAVAGDVGKVLGVSAGPAVGWVNPGGLSIPDLTQYAGTATSGQTSFTIPGVTPSQIESFQIGGEVMVEGLDWTWSGSTVTFTAGGAYTGEPFAIGYRP